jgi:hypothetical protein
MSNNTLITKKINIPLLIKGVGDGWILDFFAGD